MSKCWLPIELQLSESICEGFPISRRIQSWPHKLKTLLCEKIHVHEMLKDKCGIGIGTLKCKAASGDIPLSFYGKISKLLSLWEAECLSKLVRQVLTITLLTTLLSKMEFQVMPWNDSALHVVSLGKVALPLRIRCQFMASVATWRQMKIPAVNSWPSFELRLLEASHKSFTESPRQYLWGQLSSISSAEAIDTLSLKWQK